MKNRAQPISLDFKFPKVVGSDSESSSSYSSTSEEVEEEPVTPPPILRRRPGPSVGSMGTFMDVVKVERPPTPEPPRPPTPPPPRMKRPFRFNVELIQFAFKRYMRWKYLREQ